MPMIAVFVLWPLVEIALFVLIGGAIGVWATLAVVVGTAVLGATLMRRRGAVALRDVQRSVEQFQDPSVPMADGALTMLAGILLILPGFLTDLLGVLLLIPPVRTGIRRLTARRLAARTRTTASFTAAPHRYGQGAVIDGDYVDETDPPAPEAGRIGSSGRPSGWTRGPEAP